MEVKLRRSRTLTRKLLLSPVARARARQNVQPIECTGAPRVGRECRGEQRPPRPAKYRIFPFCLGNLVAHYGLGPDVTHERLAVARGDSAKTRPQKSAAQ